MEQCPPPVAVFPDYRGRKRNAPFDFRVDAYYYLGGDSDLSSRLRAFDGRFSYTKALGGTGFRNSTAAKPFRGLAAAINRLPQVVGSDSDDSWDRHRQEFPPIRIDSWMVCRWGIPEAENTMDGMIAREPIVPSITETC